MIQRILLFTLGFSILVAAAAAQVKPVAPRTDSVAPKTDSAVRKHPGKALAPVLPDSIYYVPQGLRIGVDLSRIAVKAFQPYRTDVSVSADYRLKKNLYAAAEAGWHTTSHSDTNYTYKGNGAFVTIGVDNNFLKKQDTKERFLFYGGVRYGFAHLNYEAPSYTIYDSYWGDRIKGSFPKTSVNAHWMELLIGIKAEVLKNFFLGWNIREKIMISGPDKNSQFPPIIIPGFGNGTKGSQIDWQYTVSYSIPLGDLRVRERRKQENPPPRR
ncbi:MAG TPA: DUF6048 family protein [Chitinophaga sp.]